MSENEPVHGAKTGHGDRADEPAPNWWRRVAWFVGLWLGSVLVLSAVAMLIKKILALE